MELRREAVFGTLALLIVMALVAFGTIGLLSRMGPEIHRILEENITSIEAAERLLTVLAGSGGGPFEPAERASYQAALEVIATNITEEGELPLVRSLTDHRAAVFAGDPEARLASIEDVDAIVQINREASRRAEARAQQLGVTGAWAVVLLTLFAMVTSYIALRRLDRRLLAPVLHLHQVLRRVSEGEPHRRCNQRGATRELDEIYAVVNDLLDHRVKTLEMVQGRVGAALHSALLRLLDERAQPTFLVQSDGEVLAANELGLAAFAGEQGALLREALRASPTADAAPVVGGHALQVERIGNSDALLCTLEPPPA